MGFDKRSEAKKYQPQDGDTLKKIAERETASGNPMTASDLAKFNWGTDDPEVVEEYLRDELGSYKRGSDKRFLISADGEIRSDLYIPAAFKRLSLPIDRVLNLRVKKVAPPPQQFQGCAMVKGVHFEFDRSFVRPSVVDDLKTLEKELGKYPGSKIIIFGHTDKVGPESYNKQLSERRAKSVYAFITNQPDVWEELYNKEDWGTKVVQEILKDMGGDYDPGPVDGIKGPKTETAIRNFQRDNGLEVDGIAGPKTRRELFSAYMSGKHDIKINEDDFMTPKHMGCGEFNPIVKTEERCEANRRVTFYLFTKDRLPVLPCKDNDLEPCKKRINPKTDAKEFPCSWYDSIAKNCPCEGGIAPVVIRSLELLSVDDHFAPSKEPLDITYSIQGYSTDEVKIRITSDHYKDNPIYERALEAEEKSDGEHAIQWDGKATCGAGDLKGRYIHPLYAPYKVVLEAVGKKTTKTLSFRVLYGDIVLEKGPWISHGTAPDKKDETPWLRYQLNELGYFGGPFTNDAAETPRQKSDLERAIRLYKCCNQEFLKRCIEDDTIRAAVDADPSNKSFYDYLDEKPGQYDGLLKKEIEKGANKRQGYFEAENSFFSDKGKVAGFQVPSLYYEKANQFSAKGEIRYDEDARRMNDPFIPILAKITILSKKDEKKDAPEAVGPAKVGWRVEDPPEEGMNARYQIDVRHDPTKPSDDKNRLKYMQDVQAWVAASGAKFSDGTPFKKNCPASVGGKADLMEIFLSYQPFTLDKPDKLPRSEASLDTTPKWKGVLGRTGVNFCPSKIGGDSYRIIVDLDFTGLPNIEDLKKWHGADGDGRNARKVETGVVSIWREDLFVKIVQWPGVALGSYELDRVKLDYEQCYINMAVPGTGDLIDIKAVITDDEYQDLIRVFQPKNLEPKLTAAVGADDAERIADDATPGWVKFLFIPLWQKFEFTNDCLYGRDLPEQEDLAGTNYRTALKALFYDRTDGFIYKLSRPLGRLIARKLRPKHPRGHVIVAFRPHRPVDILNDGSDKSKGYLEHGYVSAFVSFGLPDGVVTYDLGDNDRRGYVVVHEFGHHNFLYHHEGAGDTNPKHHDTSDHNCIMSYTTGTAPGIPGKYNPLFCGKCNLRLRGWKVTGGSIPGNS